MSGAPSTSDHGSKEPALTVVRKDDTSTSKTDYNAEAKKGRLQQIVSTIVSIIVSTGGLCLAFSLVFFPMLAVTFVLLGLVTWAKVDFPNPRDANLTVSNQPPTSSYYTLISPGKFALVSSWASTVVGSASAPFLTLFSFLIARSLVRRLGRLVELNEGHKDNEPDLIQIQQLLHEIQQLLHARNYMKLCRWTKKWLSWRGHKLASDEAAIIAVGGVGLALLCMTLIIAGDNWLHFAVGTEVYRQYNDTIIYPVPDPSAPFDDPNSPLYETAAGYAPLDACQAFLNRTSPPDTLPCSLTNTSQSDIAQPLLAYLTLDTGISNTKDNFSSTDFNEVRTSQDSNTASVDQVVTYLDTKSNTNHSFLFYLDSTQQFNQNVSLSIGRFQVKAAVSNAGFDYVAPTHSMQTTCEVADAPCDLIANSSLYNCSSIFSGNISQESTDGTMRIPNWDTTFYKIDEGVPKEITAYEDQNPFTFNVTVQVDTDVLGSRSIPDSLIQTSNGSAAFALKCTGSVYEVNYTMLSGSIAGFQTRLADPRLASIVRAPLQVGFGRYNLYISATQAVLALTANNSEPLESYMGRVFSQTAVALSRGAFNYTSNRAQLVRGDVTVTAVSKAAVWFLATACAVYALAALIVFVIALFLRRNEKIRNMQQQLGLEDIIHILKELAKKEADFVGEKGAEDGVVECDRSNENNPSDDDSSEKKEEKEEDEEEKEKDEEIKKAKVAEAMAGVRELVNGSDNDSEADKKMEKKPGRSEEGKEDGGHNAVKH